ncbi:MAG: hypothetical protein AB7R89_19090 [Dehalococcoidia bacterium]
MAGTVRCPYCREPFPKPLRIAIPSQRPNRPTDALPWLALAWIAAMIPLCLLVLVTLGVPFALPAFIVSFVPAIGIWMLRHRAARRIRRLGRRDRRGAAGAASDTTDQPSNTSRDARSR